MKSLKKHARFGDAFRCSKRIQILAHGNCLQSELAHSSRAATRVPLVCKWNDTAHGNRKAVFENVTLLAHSLRFFNSGTAAILCWDLQCQTPQNFQIK